MNDLLQGLNDLLQNTEKALQHDRLKEPGYHNVWVELVMARGHVSQALNAWPDGLPVAALTRTPEEYDDQRDGMTARQWEMWNA